MKEVRTPVLTELLRDECLQLLESQQVGRLAVVADGYPYVVPVNYALDGERIIIRTDPGTKFYAADREHVGFEIDGIDEATRTGWSVLVEGVAREVKSPEDPALQRAESLGVDTWVPGERTRWLVIEPVRITGRALSQVVGPLHVER
jgi:nitroimidazol reductase NimA-like FMN-containing flavoprotein (pyridoxamine 5'-phosphate oxidase superfamily)